MRFLVPLRFGAGVRKWIDDNYSPGKFSEWYPFYYMSTGESAIMANIDNEDCLIFALTFEHEKLDKE